MTRMILAFAGGVLLGAAGLAIAQGVPPELPPGTYSLAAGGNPAIVCVDGSNVPRVDTLPRVAPQPMPALGPGVLAGVLVCP